MDQELGSICLSIVDMTNQLKESMDILSQLSYTPQNQYISQLLANKIVNSIHHLNEMTLAFHRMQLKVLQHIPM